MRLLPFVTSFAVLLAFTNHKNARSPVIPMWYR
jgi:hypothetical protein